MRDIKDYSTKKDRLSAFFGAEVLNHYGVKRTFRKGAVIFKEGEKGDYLFVIKSGKVKVYHLKDGKEIIVAKLGEGSIVGEMAVITGKPRSASVEVLEDMEAYVIDSESLFNVFKDHPQIREIIGVESIKREEENIQKLLEDE